MRLTLEKRLYALTAPHVKKFEKSVFVRKLTKEGHKWEEIQDECFNFYGRHSIVVKNVLLRFRDTEPLSITKYSGIGTNSKIRVEELPSLPYNQYYWMYSLAALEDRYVMVTGGRGRPLHSF